MQITRDLRNDFSHGLSSALALVPKEVYDEWQRAVDENDTASISEPINIPDELLDYDIANAVSNIRLHREIIEKQMEARRKCIQLLIKSRCEFGSSDDAKKFYTLDDITALLKTKKAQILDAMEMEGLDFEGLEDSTTSGVNNESEDALPKSFTWFTKEAAVLNNTKKQRIE